MFSSGEKYEKVKAEVLQFSEANKDELKPRFHLKDVDRSINDIQMDGQYVYEKKYICRIIIFSTQCQAQFKIF